MLGDCWIWVRGVFGQINKTRTTAGARFGCGPCPLEAVCKKDAADRGRIRKMHMVVEARFGCGLSPLALPAGIEPATNGLGNRCSIP